jgi:hypothetical protein
LNLNDIRLLGNVLEAIEELLKLDEINGWTNTMNSVAYALEVNKGVDLMEDLQKHPNMDIYRRAQDI